MEDEEDYEEKKSQRVKVMWWEEKGELQDGLALEKKGGDLYIFLN